jgi:hypothetical protein
MDVAENVPEDSPYKTLKARLLETYTLSDQEKMDILFKSEQLGGSILSQMLANMLAKHAGLLSCSSTCSCSICPSSCGLCSENRSLVTSEAWQPGRTSCGPLTGSSSMIWWPMWTQLRNSQLRLQLFRRRSLHKRSLTGRSLEVSRRPAEVVRRLLVLVLALGLVALLILSMLGIAQNSVFTTGITNLGLASVWPHTPGRETRV